jgi:hypothetical protein
MQDKPKHAGGRPLKFQSVEELQAKIDDYFEVTGREKWSIVGLAIHLGTFRNVLMDYQDKDEFSTTIKSAKSKVELAYEESGMRRGNAFDIFRMKNMGWKDSYENKNSNENTNFDAGSLDPKLADDFSEFMKQKTTSNDA